MTNTSEKLSKQCKSCGKTFYKPTNLSMKNWTERSVFCSRACINKGRVSFRKGKPLGYDVWNKGKKGLQVAWNKGIHYEQLANDKHPLWKGDDATLIAKHNWVVRRLGRPKKCEHCGTTEDRMYHWANISGEYKRDLSDWKRLCVPCHKRYDLDKIAEKSV
jgi:hypothetical protein